MSNLQKSVLKSRLPPCAPPRGRLVLKISKIYVIVGFTGTIIHHGLLRDLFAPYWYISMCFLFDRDGPKKGRQKDYTPGLWDEYFEDKKDVAIDANNKFRVYLSRSPQQNGPLVVLLHGGGYSALTWSHFTVRFVLPFVACDNDYESGF